MSDTARTQLFVMKEASYGVVPAIAFNTLRFTGESLQYTENSSTSNEIRSDREVSDVTALSGGMSGGIELEMSYGNADTILESALMSTWGSTLTKTGTTLSAASGDNSFNDSANTMPAFVVGQWFKASGFGTAANNGYFQVVSRTVAKIVVAGASLVTEAAGATATVTSTAIRNGTTKTSMVLEKKFADLTLFQSYTGVMVDTMDFNLSTGKFLTASVNLKGKDGSALAGATVGTGAAVAAVTGPIMNATDNVVWVKENAAALPAGIIISDAKISLSNNLRETRGLSSLTPSTLGLGQFEVKGSITAYFSEQTLYQKFKNRTQSSLAFNVTDGTNNNILSIPALRYTSAKIVAGGKNQDVMVELGFTAFRNSTSSHSFEITKF